MSAHHYRWVWSQKIRFTQKLIMLSLAREAGDDGKCSKSIAKISMDTGTDRKTIMRGIQELEKAGLLTINRTPGQESSYQLQEPTGSKSASRKGAFFVIDGGRA